MVSFDSTRLLRIIGPGLLFASTAIGTSHLVLSTRAGAHYGMIFFWIILGAQILKYPFFEFGPRYSAATGKSILSGYRQQGKWAVVLFLLVIGVNMFAVTGAVGAVSGGLLHTVFGMSLSMELLVGVLFVLTAILLLAGRYKVLDNFVKVLSFVLLVSVLIAFVSVIVRGPLDGQVSTSVSDLLEGAGLALTVGLIGFMPTGMEISVIHSMWSVENARTRNLTPTLRDTLIDFNVGYFLTTVVALMFLTVGSFTIYGSGKLMENNAVHFTTQLLEVFTTNLGKWSYYFVALAAFGTIYGTFLAAWDAFARGFAGGVQVLMQDEGNKEVSDSSNRRYNWLVIIIGVGGYLLYYQFAGGMIKLLDAATIVVFLTAPIICVLNLRAVTSSHIPVSFRPHRLLLLLSYIGILFIMCFTGYYLWTLY